MGLGHAAIEAAHLDEAIAKTEQAFGSSSGKILAMADQLVERFGAIKTEVLDVAASFGLMLQGAGIGTGRSAEMSIDLTKRIADMASIWDIPMQEAIQRMQSGLSGEMEAVRKWGADLSETNVKAKATTMGFKPGAGGEFSQRDKMLVREQILMEATAYAAGDADRSWWRLTGQMKLFGGRLTELATTLGARLVPVLDAILIVVNAGLWVWIKLEQAINAAGKALISFWAKSTFGWDVFGDEGAAERQKQIDKQKEAMKANLDKDAAAAAAMKKDHVKGWQGGIVEYAGKIQDAAWANKGKDATFEEQKKQTAILQAIADAWKKAAQAPSAQPAPWF